MPDEAKIPKGRIRRSAKLGSIIGTQGARYAGTKAANVMTLPKAMKAVGEPNPWDDYAKITQNLTKSAIAAVSGCPESAQHGVQALAELIAVHG